LHCPLDTETTTDLGNTVTFTLCEHEYDGEPGQLTAGRICKKCGQGEFFVSCPSPFALGYTVSD
jgi:hypothetical protein